MLDITTSPLPRVNILGVGIHAITHDQALQQISNWIDQRARHRVSLCTVHTVMECQYNPQLQQTINQASLATPDGMPLVWLSRYHSGIPVNRVYGPDLMLDLCAWSETRGYRHYFYGGHEQVTPSLVQKLHARFPRLQIAGYYAPPFRPLTPVEQTQQIERLNASRADIIWVGLGTPKQDLWMAQYREYLTAPILIGVGAAFNIHSGHLRQAPRWMQNSGLEWLFRLTQEPRRLWYRYLIYNPLFILSVMAQHTGLKSYPLD